MTKKFDFENFGKKFFLWIFENFLECQNCIFFVIFGFTSMKFFLMNNYDIKHLGKKICYIQTKNDKKFRLALKMHDFTCFLLRFWIFAARIFCHFCFFCQKNFFMNYKFAKVFSKKFPSSYVKKKKWPFSKPKSWAVCLEYLSS